MYICEDQLLCVSKCKLNEPPLSIYQSPSPTPCGLINSTQFFSTLRHILLIRSLRRLPWGFQSRYWLVISSTGLLSIYGRLSSFSLLLQSSALLDGVWPPSKFLHQLFRLKQFISSYIGLIYSKSLYSIKYLKKN